MSKTLTVGLILLAAVLVGLCRSGGTVVAIDEGARLLGLEVRVRVSVQVNPRRTVWDRPAGLVCVVPADAARAP